MRLFLIPLIISVVAVSAATLKSNTTDNAFALSNAKSHEFAKGDSGRALGWRECVEIEASPTDSGIVCEGTRTIKIPGGQLVEVNYFCEFRYVRVASGWFRLDYQLCQ